MGAKHGIAHNTVHAISHMINRGASMAGVSQDATSLIYCPATNGEWTQTMAAAGISSGNPSALWLLQEASGNPADSIGSFTLTATGAPAYQQAQTGWTRKTIVMTDAASQNMANTSASLPDIATTSAALLIYIAYTGTPAATRNSGTLGTTTSAIGITTTPNMRVASNANTASGSTVLGTTTIPHVLMVNRTSSTVTGYSATEKVTPTFSSGMTGKKVTLGPTSAASNAPPAGFGYAALFTGAAAELTDAQWKALLQVLGWTVTGY